jgi:sugar O-acyltransferase, sialic acid O-acetyltransferase NeuD family
MELSKKICIVGVGGFGREVLCYIKEMTSDLTLKIEDIVCFMEKDECYKESRIMGIDVIPQSSFKPECYNVVVAIGDPATRKKVVESLPLETTYTSIVHPRAIICEGVEWGEGAIIAPGVILTTNIKIGKHAHLNVDSSVGHDCVIGDYLTTAAGVRISGNCIINNCVYLGHNSCIMQGVKICSDAKIGMCAGVIRNITQPGTYVGMPARNIG